MHTFKVLAGNIVVGDGKTYNRGDLIQSEKELDKQFGPKKFLRLEGLTQVVETPDAFEGMTVSELKKFAKEEEIDLGGAGNKEDILSVLRKATS
jgi:hypothetical protein